MKINSEAIDKLRSKVSTFGQDSFWVGIAVALNSAASFGLNLYLTNYLSKEDYGLYQYVFSLSGIISILSLTGLKTAITQSVARGKNKFYRDLFFFSFKTNILMAIVFFGAGLYFNLKGNSIVARSCVLLGLCQPLTVAFSIYESFLQGGKQFKVLSLWSVGINFFVTAVTSLSLWSTKNLELAILVSILLRCLLTYFPFYQYWRSTKNIKTDHFQVQETKKSSMHFSFANILGGINAYLDKIIMQSVVGFSGVAEIAVIGYVPNFAKSISKAASTILLPKIAQTKYDDIKKNFRVNIIQLFFFGLVMALVLFQVIPLPIKWFFPKYIDQTFWAQISILEIIFLTPGIYIGNMLRAKRLTKELYNLTTMNGVFKCISLLVMGNLYGVKGVVCARLMTNFFGFTLSTIMLCKKFEKSDA